MLWVGLCILELLLVLGQLKKYYELCSKSLHNSPARRAVYLCVSSSDLYPKKFIATRWVEIERVANWAIEIWGDIVMLIKLFTAKFPSKQPKDNALCNTWKEHYTNPFIIVCLYLFRDAAARLNGFLIKFQTNGAMVPVPHRRNGWNFAVTYGFLYSKRGVKSWWHFIQTFQTSSVRSK